MNDNDNQSNNEEVIALRNQNLLLCAIHQALPEPVEQKIRSYLKKCLEKNPEVRFHGSLDRDSAISFFLYWIIEYDSEAYQEKLFGYPHSNISSLHRKFYPFLKPFSDRVINFKNYDFRHTAANSFHAQYKHSLSDITLVGDSTPIPLEWTHNEDRSGDAGTWCNRVKGPDAVSYAHHDIHRLKEYWQTIKQNLSTKDCLALDTGYLSFDRSDRGCKFHIKKRSGKNHPLSKEDQLLNVKIEESRRFIEIEFDKLKSTFRIIKHKYRGDRKDLSEYVRFCFALHNEKAEYEYSPKKYSNEWTGPVPHLEFEKKGNKHALKYAFISSSDSEEGSPNNDPIPHDSDLVLVDDAPASSPKHNQKRRKTEIKKS